MFPVKTRTNFKIGNKIGRLGEDIAAKYLINKGYAVIARNYRKKWGEIDLIARKGLELRFIEVKSVSREIPADVTRETSQGYRPEDNVHHDKLQRLSRTIQTYISEYGISDKIDWHFDVITVIIDQATHKAAVNTICDLIL